MSFKILEWLGAVLGLIGALLLTQKLKFGFIIFSVFNLLWLALGIFRSEYGVAFLMLGYLVVNLRGYVKWSIEEKAGKVIQIGTKKDLS